MKFKIRRLIVSGAVALLMVSLAACSAGEGGTPDVGVTAARGDLHVGPLPASIDPVATTQRVVGLVAGSVCEGLFANTADLGWSEGLVDKWEYDKDVTYVFTLRKGVNFHDGSVLTAADVVASLKRYAASAPGATFGGLVKSIEETGDLQVTLTLLHPSAAVPALLATPDSAAYIMPASIVADRDPSDPLQKLVCTGPYKMDSYVPDQTVKLSRFDGYTARTDQSDGAAGKKVAILDTITFDPTDASNALNLIRTSALDVQSQLALDQAISLKNDPSVKPLIIPNASFPLLQLNTKAGLLANQKLRQAVLAAINSKEVMAAAAPSSDYYNLDSSLMPPKSPWHSKAGSELYNQNDPKKSRKLQAEAGYHGEPLRLLYQASDAFTPVVVSQLEAAGFKVQAQVLDGPTFTQKRADESQWDMFMSGGSSYGDPLTVVFMSSGFPGWWNTPEKQELMGKLLSGTTQDERFQAWEGLQKLIYEQVPFVRFGGRAQIDALSTAVDEYPPFPGSARGFFNVSLKAK